MNAPKCEQCGKFCRVLIPVYESIAFGGGIDREVCVQCKVTPEPIPTRCDCRFHDDGITTTCGIHEPPALVYYTEEES